MRAVDTYEPDFKAIRAKLGLTQAAFADTFGFPVRTIQDWEYKRRTPTGGSRTLLFLIEFHTQFVIDTLRD